MRADETANGQPGALRPCILAVTVYTGLAGISFASGLGMHVPIDYYQFLDPVHLRDRLWESLMHLHAQPPLLNFLLGAGVKLEVATGIKIEWIFTWIHLLLGACAVVGWVMLVRALIEGRVRRFVCTALVVVNPVFYAVLFTLFYTFHETVILALLAHFVGRFFRTKSLGDWAAVGLLMTLLTLTHSLFHFLWAIGMLAWILALGRGTPAASGHATMRSLLFIFGLATVLILAWPVKNWILFDTFSSSSWVGFNLSHGLPSDQDPYPTLTQSAPPEFAAVPVLSEAERSDGTLNWNHHAIIAESRVWLHTAVTTMRERPNSVLVKAARNYWHFTRFSGRHPYQGLMWVDGDIPPVLMPWFRGFEITVLLDFRHVGALQSLEPGHMPWRPWRVSGLFLLFPAIVALAALKVRRLWDSDPLRARLSAFLLMCVLWVLLMALFVDGTEGNRLRFSTEPYLIALAVWAMPTRRTKALESEAGASHLSP